MEHSDSKIPRHVGVIIDGNRRFAKRLMMKPWQGHEWGAKKFERLLEWSMELGIKELTLYVFSLENFNRPKECDCESRNSCNKKRSWMEKIGNCQKNDG